MRTCVTPEAKFIYGIHKPSYRTKNLRVDTKISKLGSGDDLGLVTNEANFPQGDINVESADWIFEIPNPFPFRGATYIGKEWADAASNRPYSITIPAMPEVSFHKLLNEQQIGPGLIHKLPAPLQLALSTCSTDPEDLISLAEISCEIEKDSKGQPVGICYRGQGADRSPIIHDRPLFKAVANNPHLPDNYKNVMVLMPGSQGNSEIVGEWPKNETTHIYEYLRRNSYISGGHYAANMSEDAIRYSIDDLTLEDITGLRHLYYQRTYVRLAEELGLEIKINRRPLAQNELESLRLKIAKELQKGNPVSGCTLWGWNFGVDTAPTGYRLHGSHQQIHQQYALIPSEVDAFSGNLTTSCGTIAAFNCGDLVAEVVDEYYREHNSSFFRDYIQATLDNRRMDGRVDLDSSLIVWQDDNVMLFVPKAQTSQWELQLVTLEGSNGRAPGNIVETDDSVRDSLNRGILYAQKCLAGLGAEMVTTIEYAKRINITEETDQHLLYSFLPRLPWSPGAFSEAQNRYITGHYPEDFGAACRKQLQHINS